MGGSNSERKASGPPQQAQPVSDSPAQTAFAARLSSAAAASDAAAATVVVGKPSKPQRRPMWDDSFRGIGYLIGSHADDITAGFEDGKDIIGKGRDYMEWKTGKKRKPHQTRSATVPPIAAMYSKPIHMRNNSYARVTRSYQSSCTLGEGPAGSFLKARSGDWTPLFMSMFNSDPTTGGWFYEDNLTAGGYSALAMSFRFDSTGVTGVTPATGPRMVRGGPQSGSYMTDPMNAPIGWTAWNNDFNNLQNIFRYAKVDKLEMEIKIPPARVIMQPMTATTNGFLQAQLDEGVLYVVPWAGQPDFVRSYNAYNGELEPGATNGVTRGTAFWRSLPGVIKIPYRTGANHSRIIKVPIRPIQPFEIPATSTAGTDATTVGYRETPTVDLYNFTAGTTNFNSFGFIIYWEHPDMMGQLWNLDTNTPPHIDVRFMGQMTWWGLLGPDETPGTAMDSPVAVMSKAPGADKVYRDWVKAQMAKQEAEKEQELDAVQQVIAATTGADQDMEVVPDLKKLKLARQ